MTSTRTPDGYTWRATRGTSGVWLELFTDGATWIITSHGYEVYRTDNEGRARDELEVRWNAATDVPR